MRSIKKIHHSEYRPMGDLVTYSPVPTRSVEQIDPFLFLNHHGPQTYPPNNHGLPFGPHPHRGMETVTFIIDGDIVHQDSTGHKSVIESGGIQWMTAGSGLIHSEVSSEKFKNEGGALEILQLWLNLPASHKMTKPFYKGFQKDDIPKVKEDDGKVVIDVIAGKYKGTPGSIDPILDLFLSLVYFQKGGTIPVDVPPSHNIFFYVIRGGITVNNQHVKKLQLAEFENDQERLEMEAEEDSILLFGHAEPINEPVVARGPFVMNTEEEIYQAYADYQSGKFGSWDE